MCQKIVRFIDCNVLLDVCNVCLSVPQAVTPVLNKHIYTQQFSFSYIILHFLLQLTLADIWFFSSLEFAILAFPDIMEWNEWIKNFVVKVKAEERMKKYLEDRPTPFVNLQALQRKENFNCKQLSRLECPKPNIPAYAQTRRQ